MSDPSFGFSIREVKSSCAGFHEEIFAEVVERMLEDYVYRHGFAQGVLRLSRRCDAERSLVREHAETLLDQAFVELAELVHCSTLSV